VLDQVSLFGVEIVGALIRCDRLLRLAQLLHQFAHEFVCCWIFGPQLEIPLQPVTSYVIFCHFEVRLGDCETARGSLLVSGKMRVLINVLDFF
jgi:hypothetical protein